MSRTTEVPFAVARGVNKMAGTYERNERPSDRMGANAMQEIPSRTGDTLRYKGGRVTDLQGNPVQVRPDDRFEDPPVHRVVEAAAAVPVKTSAPNSIFGHRARFDTDQAASAEPIAEPKPEPKASPVATPAPVPASISPSPSPTTEEASMPKQIAVHAGSTQLRICALLRDSPLTRAELAKQAADLSNTQLHNAVFNAKKNARIAVDGDKVRLTKAGRAWLESQLGGNAPPAAKAKAKAVAAVEAVAALLPAVQGFQRSNEQIYQPAPPPPRATETLQVYEHPRYGLMSDGSFLLQRNGQRVELTPDEFGAMQMYLQRARGDHVNS